MNTQLDKLLASIDPDRTLDEVDRRADQALNSFSPPEARIDRWEPFRACLIQSLRHVEKHLLRLSKAISMGVAFDWGRCCRTLKRIYGVNGEKAAFEMARTGNEGGLRAVLRKMARQMAREAAENEIAARVGCYWDRLSVDEKLNASQEYLAKYGHLLPSELTEGSAARIRANLPKVLEQHPHLIRRLRQVARS